ncbi:rRNA processing protein, variant 3 [Balamuthia mandrillaris]
MNPFLELMIVYLCNTMTHLKLDVRLSALSLVDLLLQHHPPSSITATTNVVADSNNKSNTINLAAGGSSLYARLLPNFMSLLAPPSGGSGGSGARARLDGNAAQAVRHRLPVLRSLFKLLSALLAPFQSSAASSSVTFPSDAWNWDRCSGSSQRQGKRVINITKNYWDSFFQAAAPPSLLSSSPSPSPSPSLPASPSLPSPSSTQTTATTTNAQHSTTTSNATTTNTTTTSSSSSSTSSASSNGATTQAAPKVDGEDFRSFMERIIPVLLECWLESSPGEFLTHLQVAAASPSASSGSDAVTLLSGAECMVLVADIMHLLLQAFPSSGDNPIASETLLDSLIRYVMPYFPFPTPSGAGSNPKFEAAEKLNLAVCLLMSHFIGLRRGPSPQAAAAQQRREQQRAIAADPTGLANIQPVIVEFEDEDSALETIEEWKAQLVTFFVSALKQGGRKNPAGQGQRAVALLPVLKKLLPNIPLEPQQRLMEAFHKFYESCHVMSSAIPACVQWMEQLILATPFAPLTNLRSTDPSLVGGRFGTRRFAYFLNKDRTKQWLLSFPKLLWKLQTHAPPSTLVIVEAMLSIAKCFSRSEQLRLDYLQLHMIPFFFACVPAAAGRSSQAKKLFGPFIHLPGHVQRKCIELLYYLGPISSPKMHQALTACSRHLSMEVLQYMLEILHHIFEKGHLTESHYASLLLSILLANAASSNNDAAELQQKQPSDCETSSAPTVILIDEDGAKEERPTPSSTSKGGRADTKKDATAPTRDSKAVACLLHTNMRQWGVLTALRWMQPALLPLLQAWGSATTSPSSSLLPSSPSPSSSQALQKTMWWFLGLCSADISATTTATMTTTSVKELWEAIPNALLPYLWANLMATQRAKADLGACLLLLCTDSSLLFCLLRLIHSHLNLLLASQQQEPNENGKVETLSLLLLSLLEERMLEEELRRPQCSQEVPLLVADVLNAAPPANLARRLQTDLTLLYGSSSSSFSAASSSSSSTSSAFEAS